MLLNFKNLFQDKGENKPEILPKKKKGTEAPFFIIFHRSIQLR